MPDKTKDGAQQGQQWIIDEARETWELLGKNCAMEEWLATFESRIFVNAPSVAAQPDTAPVSAEQCPTCGSSDFRVRFYLGPGSTNICLDGWHVQDPVPSVTSPPENAKCTYRHTNRRDPLRCEYRHGHTGIHSLRNDYEQPDNEECDHGHRLYEMVGCRECFDNALKGAMDQAESGSASHILNGAPFDGCDCVVCGALRKVRAPSENSVSPATHANFMQTTGEGLCFAHGPYKNANKSGTCPKWSACITDPQKPEYLAMSKAAAPTGHAKNPSAS